MRPVSQGSPAGHFWGANDFGATMKRIFAKRGKLCELTSHNANGFTTESKMLEWFTDSAFFPCCIGIFLTVTFIGLALASGEMSMLKFAAISACITAILVVVEVSIVTDKEEIENTVHEMAAAMHESDFDRVMSYLDSEDLVSRARAELRGSTCHLCRITAINEVNVDENGEAGTIDFVAYAKASNRQFPTPTPVQSRIKLDFEKQNDGQWKVVDFEASSPRAGLTP